MSRPTDRMPERHVVALQREFGRRIGERPVLASGAALRTHRPHHRSRPVGGTSPLRAANPLLMADPAHGQSGPPLDISWYCSSGLDRSGLVFTPLAGTADEAQALQGLLQLDAKEVLTGANATEEKLKRLHGRCILHVATDGFFLSDQKVAAATLWPVGFGAETPPLPPGENPLLRSGLDLGRGRLRRSGESDDGILTAAEATQLDLRGTQLVVLSACETGLGEVQQGGGCTGFAARWCSQGRRRNWSPSGRWPTPRRRR